MRNTTLCYIEKDGCYLMLHRIKKEKDINRDKWIGVGGKFLDGESPEDCIVREMAEETGLAPSYFGSDGLAYRGIVTFVTDLYESEYMHLFTCRDFFGELKECDEGVMEWVDKNNIDNLNLWEGDKIFLDLLDSKEEPFFSLKLIYGGCSLIKAVLNGNEIALPYKKKTKGKDE